MKALALLLLPLLLPIEPVHVQAAPQAATTSSPRSGSPDAFDTAATDALNAMRSRADQLKVTGVAVVAYMPGETLLSWSSKMAVVGRYKDLPTAADKGSNLLGIVYAKAAEMADTRKDSGHLDRAPMTGEFGWQGGVTARVPSGYVLVAFSGGKSEDDVEVSRAGLAALEHLR